MKVDTTIPLKQIFFRGGRVLIQNWGQFEAWFCVFMAAVDDNHAVTLARDYLKNHTSMGSSIIKNIGNVIE